MCQAWCADVSLFEGRAAVDAIFVPVDHQAEAVSIVRTATQAGLHVREQARRTVAVRLGAPSSRDASGRSPVSAGVKASGTFHRKAISTSQKSGQVKRLDHTAASAFAAGIIGANPTAG